MSDRTLVTAALPYANGSLHIGHLVEYCQADIYVRAMKRLGTEALYICANDAHGTPIELNAARLGLAPEALVARVHEEHQRDFARFDVDFDHFGITHSDINRRVVEEVYAKLRRGGHLEDREVEGNWCEQDQRFLPDRFIKGTCPRCGAEDQYGDVCEVCGATYSPTELKQPRCSLCGTAPVIKKSLHVFFKLSAPEHVEFLRRFIDGGALQPDVANYVRNWIDTGLKDWCISRDGPYFGFPIPDRPGKYFYVWLDAPFGYIASSVEWGERHGKSFDDLWRSPATRVEHVIGKDIVYFHTLFWPAVLNAVGYTLPSRVNVHGMLTVNGEKMSKSRGTFINAAVFAEHVEPQALRYYYASKLGSQTDDIDLALDDFVLRVNGELVNKHANLFSRASQFLVSKLDGRLGELPFSAAEAQAESTGDGSLADQARRVVAACRRVERLYRQRELGQVVRELSLVADIGNEHMQAQQPWEQLKSDPEAARLTCTFAVNVCHALAMYLWPIVPRFATAGARVLGSTIERLDASLLFAERNRPIGAFERLFERIDRKAIDALLEASRESLAKGAKPAPDRPAKKQEAAAPTARVAPPVAGEAAKKQETAAAAARPAPPAAELAAGKPLIGYEQFQALDLRVGRVLQAERIPKSKKLLRLQVDLGEAEPRQIVAGIALAYAPEQLVGTSVVVVANLQPAKVMSVESRGMVLAGGDGEGLAVMRPDRELPPGAGVR